MFSLQQVTVNTAIVPYGNTVMDGLWSPVQNTLPMHQSGLCANMRLLLGFCCLGVMHFTSTLQWGGGGGEMQLNFILNHSIQGPSGQIIISK